jgi:hypothetical protein
VGATIVVWLVNVTVGWFLDRVSGKPSKRVYSWEVRR